MGYIVDTTDKKKCDQCANTGFKLTFTDEQDKVITERHLCPACIDRMVHHKDYPKYEMAKLSKPIKCPDCGAACDTMWRISGKSLSAKGKAKVKAVTKKSGLVCPVGCKKDMKVIVKNIEAEIAEKMDSKE